MTETPKPKEKKVDPALEEVYNDLDGLMNRILDRLNAQTGVIGAATKLKVSKMFIAQICTGGNKVYLEGEVRKIEKKIMKFTIEDKTPLPSAGKGRLIQMKQPTRKQRRKNKKN